MKERYLRSERMPSASRYASKALAVRSAGPIDARAVPLQHARVSPLRRRFRVVHLLLSVCAASACGDRTEAPQPKPLPPAARGDEPSKQPSKQPSSATRGKAPDDDRVIPCSVAPAAMAGEILGLPGLALTKETVSDKATLCEYNVPAADKFVSIRFERGYAPERFDPSKAAFENPTDVAGIGDRAFTSQFPSLGPHTPDGINSIAVLAHRTHLSVSAPVKLEKVTLLARELLHEI